MNTQEKNYNLELIRMCAFMMVVLIHVTNYYCRAYGQISLDQYIFAMVLDNIARISMPCFFMLTGALLLGREAYYDLPLIGDRSYMFYVFIGCYLHKYLRKLPGRGMSLALLFALCMLINSERRFRIYCHTATDSRNYPAVIFTHVAAAQNKAWPRDYLAAG